MRKVGIFIIVVLAIVSGLLVLERNPGASEPHILDASKTVRPAESSDASIAAPQAGLSPVAQHTAASTTFKKKAENLFDQPDSKEKLESLDREFYQFINDPALPRTEKISILMELLRSREGNQALYVLDHLAQLTPLEQAPDLIQMFSTSQSNQFKSHLLTTIRETLIADWANVGSGRPSQEEIKKFEQTIFDFSGQLALQSNDQLSKFAVLEMTPLLPDDWQEQVLASLDAARLAELQIAPDQLGNLFFDLAVTDPNAKNIARMRDLLDAQTFEADSKFVERMLSTLRQVSRDSRYQDFSREMLGRVGDLSLSPALYVKAKEVELSLNGMPEEEFMPEMRKLLETSSIIEQTALILGTSEQLLASQNDSVKAAAASKFLSQAENTKGTSREQILTAGLAVSGSIDDINQREALEKQMCNLLGASTQSSQCQPYLPAVVGDAG